MGWCWNRLHFEAATLIVSSCFTTPRMGGMKRGEREEACEWASGVGKVRPDGKKSGVCVLSTKKKKIVTVVLCEKRVAWNCVRELATLVGVATWNATLNVREDEIGWSGSVWN
ncbi:hypothetical protein B0J18DRAFT_273891 [Chaetomium sp. MPI-SDFR-AT-0129]|nr:hypothetical protein B0J18DRAFT_273891 [Chaetomium sp. MPI-SDFR-AT-0129]